MVAVAVSRQRPSAVELERLYRAGDSTRTLAARYGVSEDTMRRWLDQAGVRRRSLSEALMLYWEQQRR